MDDDSSDDSEDLDDKNLASSGIAKTPKNQKGFERKKSLMHGKADLVAMIENNENYGECMPEKLEQASQLLSFDKDFYNVKKELFLYAKFQ